MGYILDIKTELNNDPAALGYATIINDLGLTEAQINTQLTVLINSLTTGITRPAGNMAANAVLALLDPAEVLNITSINETKFWGVLGMEVINLGGVAYDILIDALGVTSQSSLNSARNETVSRAIELFGRQVKEGHIEMAMALP